MPIHPLMLRRQPEDLGLLPDGEPQATDALAQSSPREQSSSVGVETLSGYGALLWVLIALLGLGVGAVFLAVGTVFLANERGTTSLLALRD